VGQFWSRRYGDSAGNTVEKNLKRLLPNSNALVAFSALTVLVGRQEGHPACKKEWRGWWRWALVSADGVAPSRMASVSASVNLPLHHKVQRFSSGTGSPSGPGKRAVKQLWWWWWVSLDQRACPLPPESGGGWRKDEASGWFLLFGSVLRHCC